MPETNGLKQVLDGLLIAENGEMNNDSLSVPPLVDDDAAGKRSDAGTVDDDVAAVVNTVVDQIVDQEQELQEPSAIQIDHIENGENGDSLESDERMTEDGGKEDMFVDCPDELIITENKDAMIFEELEQKVEGNDDDAKEAHDYNLDSATRIEGVMDDTQNIKTFEDEKDHLFKELAKLYHQLKDLKLQQPLLNENEGAFVDGFHKSESIEMVENLSVNYTVNECSKLVSNALDERLHMVEEFRKLQSVVISKDQEIEDLHSKVSELSISQNVALSFFSSHNQSISDSSNPSLEVQYGLQNIDASLNRVLATLAMAVNGDELLDNSITGRMAFTEKNVSQLIGNYQYLLSEVELLRQSLTEVSSDSYVQEEFWSTIAVARNTLLELKRKEVDFVQQISNLEEENKKVNEDVGKIRVELEQEKSRYTNTKEKLSLAVTKGKALVQQRDSLKQSLAEKTNEIEKYLAEIEEKSRAIEAADLVKEELVRTENLAASLQETLSQKDSILSKCEELLYQTSGDHEVESVDIMDRIGCLVDEKDRMAGVLLEFNKLADTISSFDFPDNISSFDLESKVSWLLDSFSQSKIELDKLQDELTSSREAVGNEIERLTISLLAESQEKDHLREELQGLTYKYHEIVEKESHLSIEKDRTVNMLLEISGITMEGQDDADQLCYDIGTLIVRCFDKIKERNSGSSESSGLEVDLFEKMQAHLYIKDQELMLCERLLEEDMPIRSMMDTLQNELETISEELQVLKDEKSSLQKDLDRSDEKTALLREKLSMAVKKGKGLVQDRENMKKNLDDKTAEIEKLKLELEQQESALNDSRNLIAKLSANVELIPKLEADITTMKDQKNQLEQFLVESNDMIQRVMESIDGVTLPVDATFEEPVDKVLWLVRHLNECQEAKTILEQDLENLKVEVESLSSKLTEAYIAKSSLEEALLTAEKHTLQLFEEKRELAEICVTRKSLEDALSEAEIKISVLIKEKDETQTSRAATVMELETLKEEVSSQSTTLAEAYEKIKSLEDALLIAENRISQLGEEKGELAEISEARKSLEAALLAAESKISCLFSEKDEAQTCRAAAETELEKVKEEVSTLTTRLAEAYRTINSLEDALSHLETNVSLLSKENNNAQVDRNNLEDEMKKLKEEAESQASKLSDATSTIRSLEDNLSKLVGEKKNAEEEIVALNSKLNACMEQLAVLGGSLENKSLELSGHLNNLQLLSKDDTMSSLLSQSFEVKFQRIRDMDLLLRDIRNHFIQTGPHSPQSSAHKEDDSFLDKFSTVFNSVANVEIDKVEVNAEGGDSFESYFRRTVEEIDSRNKSLVNRVQGVSNSMDEFIASLLKNLEATRDEVVRKLDQMRYLEQKVFNLETDREEQEVQIAMLENDIKVLFSACSLTAQELQNEVENYQVELSSTPDTERWAKLLSEVREDAVGSHQDDVSTYIKSSENLLIAAKKVCALSRVLERERNGAADAIKNMENKMSESRVAVENAREERDLLQTKLSEVGNDLEALQSSYQEMKFKVEGYQAKETTLSGRDSEISSLHNALAIKEKEVEDARLVASLLTSICDKINDLEILFTEFNLGDAEFHDSDPLKKLLYIIDAVGSMHRQMKLLSQDKEELQSTVEKQGYQIEHLKGEYEEQQRVTQDLEKLTNEIFELELGVENIIHKLGGNDLIGDRKSAGVRGLITVLEKLVMGIILEYDNTKSKAQKLGTKLGGSQKVIDELSAKVKLLEASNQGRSSSSDGGEERNIFEAPSLPTRSEITELEDVALGKKAAAPASSAAHARSLRKGSNDHLAINIDSESDRLIKKEEVDEDKGKVFKSLNTSGLVPRQGKMFAERIDAFWVSGDRALMSRPRARLGLIAYWLLLHIWLLGTIL